MRILFDSLIFKFPNIRINFFNIFIFIYSFLITQHNIKEYFSILIDKFKLKNFVYTIFTIFKKWRIELQKCV